jgi:hypothetical protein
MILGVPVAAGNDWNTVLFSVSSELRQHRHDLVAIRHGQRTTWQKVVLHVDDQEYVTFG